ncbi:hypothetical protein EVAR_92949_1 [Eumeta japonica]|uniref:Uncharacterized protein n=1 Tax=Eumeta variegata TaxID=151549 RepID=A0A4C1TDS3_EUMVA|nr:hypothetical protein EVAR_92949_1 [Eumeta japonica]
MNLRPPSASSGPGVVRGVGELKVTTRPAPTSAGLCPRRERGGVLLKNSRKRLDGFEQNSKSTDSVCSSGQRAGSVRDRQADSLRRPSSDVQRFVLASRNDSLLSHSLPVVRCKSADGGYKSGVAATGF